MAHFALLCPEDAGHVLSNGPVAMELVRRGHQVTLVARSRARPMAEKLGLPLREYTADNVRWPGELFTWLAFCVLGQGYKIGMRCGFHWQSEALLQNVPQVLRELKVDGVLIDQTLAAGGTVADRAGVPHVTLCSALLWNEEVGLPPPFTHWMYEDTPWARRRNRLGYAGWHWFIRPALRCINRYRREWNLPAFRTIDETFSPLAQISQLCPEFDFPRRELPPQLHYIGSMAANRQAAVGDDFPWDRLDGRPLIYASLGTIDDKTNAPVLRRILDACAGLDAQLVLALGKWSEKQQSLRDALGPPPENALIVDFAPQLALLDRAALLITHAGVNTVLEAICRAVPIVALPRSADQPGMGSRVAYAGIGLRGSFARSAAADIRRLVQRTLAEETFRLRSRQLQQAMVAAGGAARAAELAEQALLGGKPVLR